MFKKDNTQKFQSFNFSKGGIFSPKWSPKKITVEDLSANVKTDFTSRKGGVETASGLTFNDFENSSMNTYAQIEQIKILRVSKTKKTTAKKKTKKLVINIQKTVKYSPKIKVEKDDPIILPAESQDTNSKKIFLKSDNEWYENEKLIRFYKKYDGLQNTKF